MLELHIHGRPLLLQLLLLLLVPLFLDAVLLCQLTELYLIKSHVPVDDLHIFHLLLHGVVGDDQSLWAAFLDAFKPILLDQLPG